MLGERHDQLDHENPFTLLAFNEDRTRDLALTKRMLCQLSYEGVGGAARDGRTPARCSANAGIGSEPRMRMCVWSSWL